MAYLLSIINFSLKYLVFYILICEPICSKSKRGYVNGYFFVYLTRKMA